MKKLVIDDDGNASEIEMTPEEIAAIPQPLEMPPTLIPKRVMVDRLHAKGKLEAARAALDSADLYTRERWNSRDSVYSTDPTSIALLQAIGCDPAEILAPE